MQELGLIKSWARERNKFDRMYIFWLISGVSIKSIHFTFKRKYRRFRQMYIQSRFFDEREEIDVYKSTSEESTRTMFLHVYFYVHIHRKWSYLCIGTKTYEHSYVSSISSKPDKPFNRNSDVMVSIFQRQTPWVISLDIIITPSVLGSEMFFLCLYLQIQYYTHRKV